MSRKYKNNATGAVINWEGSEPPTAEDLQAAERDMNFRNKTKVALAGKGSDIDPNSQNFEHDFGFLGKGSANEIISGALSPFYGPNIAESGKRLFKGLGGQSPEYQGNVPKQLNDIVSGGMGVAAPVAIPAAIMSGPAGMLSLGTGIGASELINKGIPALQKKLFPNSVPPDPDLLNLGATAAGTAAGMGVHGELNPSKAKPGLQVVPEVKPQIQGRAQPRLSAAPQLRLPAPQETLPEVIPPVVNQNIPNSGPFPMPDASPSNSPQLPPASLPDINAAMFMDDKSPFTQQRQSIQEINPFNTGSYDRSIKVSPGGQFASQDLNQIPQVSNPLAQIQQSQLPEGNTIGVMARETALPNQQLPLEKPNLTNSGQPGELKTPPELEDPIALFKNEINRRLAKLESEKGIKTPNVDLGTDITKGGKNIDKIKQQGMQDFGDQIETPEQKLDREISENQIPKEKTAKVQSQPITENETFKKLSPEVQKIVLNNANKIGASQEEISQPGLTREQRIAKYEEEQKLPQVKWPDEVLGKKQPNEYDQVPFDQVESDRQIKENTERWNKQNLTGQAKEIPDIQHPSQIDYSNAIAQIQKGNQDAIRFAASKGQEIGMSKGQILDETSKALASSGQPEDIAKKIAAFRIGQVFGDVQPVEGKMELPEESNKEGLIEEAPKSLSEELSKKRRAQKRKQGLRWGSIPENEEEPGKSPLYSGIDPTNIPDDLKKLGKAALSVPKDFGKILKNEFGTMTTNLQDSNDPAARFIGARLKWGQDAASDFRGTGMAHDAKILDGLTEEEIKTDLWKVMDGQKIPDARPELLEAAKKLKDETFDPIITKAQKDFPNMKIGRISEYVPHIEDEVAKFPALHKMFGDRIYNLFGSLGEPFDELRANTSSDNTGTGTSFFTSKPNSRFINPRDMRTSNMMTDMRDVLPMYRESMADLLHKRPAMEEAQARVSQIKDPSEREMAVKAIRSFTGDEFYPENEKGIRSFTGAVQRTVNRSLLYFSPGLQSLHAGRVGNILQDLPMKNFLQGAGDLIKDPVGSYNEVRQAGMLSNMERPWKFMRGSQKFDFVGYGMGIADFVPDAIGLQGFKRMIAEQNPNLTPEQVKIAAIGKAKDASLKQDSARVSSFIDRDMAFANPIKQWKGIQFKLAEQYLRNATDIIGKDSSLSPAQRMDKATRMAIGTGIGLYALNSGQKFYHFTPSGLFHWSMGAYSRFESLGDDFSHAAIESANGHDEASKVYINNGFGKMLRLIPGVPSADNFLSYYEGKRKSLTTGNEKSIEEQMQHKENHRLPKEEGLPVVRFLQDQP